MRINTKCSIAIHMLLIITLYSNSYKITSELLAKSTGCNAVIIRGIFQKLQEYDLIIVKRGIGGAFLKLPPEQICIWDIYCAIASDTGPGFAGIHPNPHEGCPVGAYIQQVLEEPYGKIENAAKREMESCTLVDLIGRLKVLNPDISE